MVFHGKIFEKTCPLLQLVGKMKKFSIHEIDHRNAQKRRQILKKKLVETKRGKKKTDSEKKLVETKRGKKKTDSEQKIP